MVEVERPNGVVDVPGEPRKSRFGQFACACGAIEVASDDHRIGSARRVRRDGSCLIPAYGRGSAIWRLEVDGIHAHDLAASTHGRDDRDAPHFAHAVKVRQIVAEALKDSVDAPVAVIQKLARDIEIQVAGPILEHSPLLTDEDLLEIISHGPIRGALTAIANRRQLSDKLSDGVAAAALANTGAESNSVRKLLQNKSAQIREDTLDRILDQAGRLRVYFRTPNWEDFVHLAFSEIRHYGSDNLQIVRRLRAMIDNLVAMLPGHRHAALDEQRRLLDRAIEARFKEPEQLALARIPDSQGLGGHSGYDRGRL